MLLTQHWWCRHQLVIQADEQLTAQEQQIANATKSLASKMAAGKKVPLQLTIQNANGQEVENVSFDETVSGSNALFHRVCRSMLNGQQSRCPPTTLPLHSVCCRQGMDEALIEHTASCSAHTNDHYVIISNEKYALLPWLLSCCSAVKCEQDPNLGSSLQRARAAMTTIGSLKAGH